VNLRELLTEPREVPRWGVLVASLALVALAFVLEALLSGG
jgi:hypothetical protein